MKRRQSSLALGARVLLGCAPLVAGIHQCRFLSGAAAYLKDAAHLPLASPALAAAFAAVQVLGAVAVLAGWRTRAAAFVLAAYHALLAGAIQFPVAYRAADLVARDQELGQGIRSLALAGGFLALAALGPGPHSLDRR